MNFILSFVGKLPEYIIDCIYQIRLYYTGTLYLIYNDYSSSLLNEIINFNVILIKYDDVNSDSNERLLKHSGKFMQTPALEGRPELFRLSYERMFLVNELINKYDLTDNIFMEIDNLIYNNPETWIGEFSKKELAFMVDCEPRCSTGLMYIKSKTSMQPVLDYMIKYLETENDAWVSEMRVFKFFNNANENYSYMMPTLFEDKKHTNVIEKNYENYSNQIFDPASYGQFLLGFDIFHTNGKIVLGQSNPDYYIVADRYKIKWKTDTDGYKKPYILDDNKNEWILINNLHVHSKDLKSGLSDEKIEIISREKIQFKCDVYLAETYNFANRLVHKHKFKILSEIPEKYDNPKKIFCYIQDVLKLYDKLDYFQNEFILVSSEEDTGITEDEYKKIADHPKIIKWFSCNVCFEHPKLILMPIGIRDQYWGGNIDFITEVSKNINKIKKMYFNFDLNTNKEKRYDCYEKLCKHYDFLPVIKYEENIIRLSEYEFCLCPQGNGVDTHRLLESWYLNVVPIVLENDFINVIEKHTNLPLIIVKDWTEVINLNLDYNNYKDKFRFKKYIDYNYYNRLI